MQRRATTGGNAAWVLAGSHSGADDVLWEEGGNAWLVQADGAARQQRWLALRAGVVQHVQSLHVALAQPSVNTVTLCDAIRRVVSNSELNSLATALERRLETMATRLEKSSKDTNEVLQGQVQHSQQAIHSFMQHLTERINAREQRPGRAM